MSEKKIFLSNTTLCFFMVIIVIVAGTFLYFFHLGQQKSIEATYFPEDVPIVTIRIASEVSDPSKIPPNNIGPFFGFEIELAHEVRVGRYKAKRVRVHGADQSGIGQIFVAASNLQNGHKYAFDFLNLETTDEGKTFYLFGAIKLYEIK